MASDKDKTSKEAKTYWQDVENKVLDREYLKSEFSEGELQFDIGQTKKSRRSFLQIMGFSFATMPLASCIRIPVKKALPYLHKHDDVVPGVANWYATSMDPSLGVHMLVKTREGRPIKVEGNPLSPVFRGGTAAYDQASVLSLYDSSRFHGPQLAGLRAERSKAEEQFVSAVEKAAAEGKDIYLFTPTLSSPSTIKVIEELEKKYSSLKHVVFEPSSLSSMLMANQETFSSASYPRYDLGKADFVLSFSADFLGTWLSPVEFTKQYSEKRDVLKHKNTLKHVQLESMMTLTGSNADVRLTVSPEEELSLIVNVLAHLQKKTGAVYLPLGQRLPAANSQLVAKLGDELLTHKTKSLVLSGSTDVSVQVLVNCINDLLGNYGKTIELYENPYFRGPNDAAVENALKAMGRSEVGAVLVYDCNLVHGHPRGEKLAEAFKKVPFKAAFSTFPDETTELCDVVLPGNYFLESWNDYFTAPNVLAFQQPVIQPLYGGRMFQESLLLLLGKTDYQKFLKENVAREFFTKQQGFATFEGFWNKTLHDGVVELKMELPKKSFKKDRIPFHFAKIGRQSFEEGLTLISYEKVSMRQGRLMNNPWLQELPDPITKVTWENYVLVSPGLAKLKGIKTGDVVRVSKMDFSLELPCVVQPGMSANTLAIAVGYGRKVAGKVAKEVGANVAGFIGFRNGNYQRTAQGIELATTGKKALLAQTQIHHSMEGRNLVRETTVEGYLKNPAAGNEETIKIISMWGGHERKGQQWAMVIDLNKCTGCSGCIISCNAENNVPVVGKEEVANRREMHWLRIDRYYAGDEDNPEVVHQPVMCMHCDNAPCETVCPVLATVQSSDGLNQQVYNRCVGTRYCANNCPYKVRRFNWFDYPHNDKNENLVLNPDVVVRSRGVMEKCSMCIQRIQEGRLQAKMDNRELADGDIQLACQQSCPADAIVFGDLNDPDSKAAKLLKHPRNYRLLEELNIQPRVSYLTKIRNKDS